jgi:hypothetical protein
LGVTQTAGGLSARRITDGHTREPLILRGPDKRYMPYADDEHTIALRNDLVGLREYIAATEISLEHPDVTVVGDYLQCRVTNKTTGKVNTVLVPRNVLLDVVQIYGRGSWDLGGRYYAAFQNIPSHIRLHVTIGGEAAVSLDYGYLHPLLICNKAGVVMSGDPYILPGYERPLVKRATNIAINARTRQAAIKAIADRCFTQQRGGRHPNREDLAEADQVLDSIAGRHDAIRRLYFSAGSRHRDDSMTKSFVATNWGGYFSVFCGMWYNYDRLNRGGRPAHT